MLLDVSTLVSEVSVGALNTNSLELLENTLSSFATIMLLGGFSKVFLYQKIKNLHEPKSNENELELLLSVGAPKANDSNFFVISTRNINFLFVKKVIAHMNSPSIVNMLENESSKFINVTKIPRPR